MVDPKTGETVEAQLGSARRVRTIFRANMRSARAAGQWSRIERTKAALPYLLYEIGPSEQHRPEHEAKAGLVLPVDDPFWREWMPPNGWGCKCRVRQISEREARRRGVKKAPSVKRREWENERTGVRETIPEGIDKGWNTNAGLERLRTLDKHLSDKFIDIPESWARVVAKDLVTSERFAGMVRGDIEGAIPIAVLGQGLVEVLGSKTRAVLFSDYTAGKMRKDHADIETDDYKKIQTMIDKGEAVRDNQNNIIVQHAFDGKWYRAVIKSTQNGSELYIKTFHRLDRHRNIVAQKGKNILR